MLWVAGFGLVGVALVVVLSLRPSPVEAALGFRLPRHSSVACHDSGGYAKSDLEDWVVSSQTGSSQALRVLCAEQGKEVFLPDPAPTVSMVQRLCPKVVVDRGAPLLAFSYTVQDSRDHETVIYLLVSPTSEVMLVSRQRKPGAL
jgi:hypothetical protein